MSSGPDGGVPRFAGYPTAVEGTALEKTCARFVSCIAGASIYNIVGCVDFWTILRGGTTATDLAYQHFLATPDGCNSFAATWPEVWGASPGPGCTPGCCGDGLVSACTSVSNPNLIPDTNCGAYGSMCMKVGGLNLCSVADASTADCNTCDAKGRAVVCYPADRITSVHDCAAVGLQCQMYAGAPTCGLPLCTATAGSCDGNVATNCVANRLPKRLDCDRVAGRPCDPGVGLCRTTPTADGCAIPGILCLKGALVLCGGNETHYVDCTSLGFSGCKTTQVTGGPVSICAP